jgi:hypothetical protein
MKEIEKKKSFVLKRSGKGEKGLAEDGGGGTGMVVEEGGGIVRRRRWGL